MPLENRAQIVLELFDKYHNRVFCFVRRSTDQATAEDVAQEVFIRLLTKEDLENKEINVSYLLKIADNLLKRRYQRGKRFDTFLQVEGRRKTEQTLRTERTPPGERTTKVRQGMDKLTSGERDAVRMIVCEGMSYQAAAKSLDVNVTTVNNWKFRGIQKLKQFADHDQAERGTSVPGRTDSARRSRPGQDQSPARIASSDRKARA